MSKKTKVLPAETKAPLAGYKEGDAGYLIVEYTGEDVLRIIGVATHTIYLFAKGYPRQVDRKDAEEFLTKDYFTEIKPFSQPKITEEGNAFTSDLSES